MTDLTNDQLRALAEWLAVEVCGAELLEEMGSIIIRFIFPGGSKLYRMYWKPWADLNQAWMVVEAAYLKVTNDRSNNPRLVEFLRDVNFMPMVGYTRTIFARAIFDAACQAMGWEKNDPDPMPEYSLDIGQSMMEFVARQGFEEG